METRVFVSSLMNYTYISCSKKLLYYNRNLGLKLVRDPMLGDSYFLFTGFSFTVNVILEESGEGHLIKII